MKSNEILGEHKLKITSARCAVIDVFLKSKKPLTPLEVWGYVKAKRVNNVTVYRIIELLVEKGIIKRIDLRGDAVYYEIAHEDSHHHHHIVCTKCGDIEDFESCQIEKLSTNIISRSKKFKVIKDHSFELFGLCNMCTKKYA